MLLQHLLEIPTRMTGGVLSNLLRGATRNDLSSLVAPFRTQIHDPVGTADHIEVVLDHPKIPVLTRGLEEKIFRYPLLYPEYRNKRPFASHSYS